MIAFFSIFIEKYNFLAFLESFHHIFFTLRIPVFLNSNFRLSTIVLPLNDLSINSCLNYVILFDVNHFLLISYNGFYLHQVVIN
jgi:hypothetical protein